MNFKYLKNKDCYNSRQNNKLLELTLLSILCSITICLSYLESLLFIFPILPPGAKPGFANIITMLICRCFGCIQALIIVIIKSVFVAMTRGSIAFIMSLFGGIFSTLITGFLIRFIPFKLNYIYIGIIGAAFHNTTQLIVAFFIIGKVVFYYLPFLILFSIVAGSITGLILNLISPLLFFKEEKEAKEP